MHEALASKNVILSSFVNDMSVVLDESFALNCGVDANSITQAIYTLSKLSQKEIKEKQNQGFEVVQNYDWSIAAQKTKEVYLEVLKIQKPNL
jgi:glycosyltransferase involved in cell wall biosynthesis